MTRIALPWPPSTLWPNRSRRLHWAQRSTSARAAREEARALVKASGLRPGATLCLTFCAPTRRRYDLDNALAASKAAIDGIADALGVDDSEWAITITRGEPVKGGAVIVEFAQ